MKPKKSSAMEIFREQFANRLIHAHKMERSRNRSHSTEPRLDHVVATLAPNYTLICEERLPTPERRRRQLERKGMEYTLPARVQSSVELREMTDGEAKEREQEAERSLKAFTEGDFNSSMMLQGALKYSSFVSYANGKDKKRSFIRHRDYLADVALRSRAPKLEDLPWPGPGKKRGKKEYSQLEGREKLRALMLDDEQKKKVAGADAFMKLKLPKIRQRRGR